MLVYLLDSSLSSRLLKMDRIARSVFNNLENELSDRKMNIYGLSQNTRQLAGYFYGLGYFLFLLPVA